MIGGSPRGRKGDDQKPILKLSLLSRQSREKYLQVLLGFSVVELNFEEFVRLLDFVLTFLSPPVAVLEDLLV